MSQVSVLVPRLFKDTVNLSHPGTVSLVQELCSVLWLFAAKYKTRLQTTFFSNLHFDNSQAPR